MRVRDLMSKSVVTIAPEESAALAARLLSRHELGSLPICAADGTLVGIVTDRDIVTRCVAAGEEPGRVPVRYIMSPAPSVITPETPISDAARLMAQRQVRRLPVVEQGHVVGMLSLGDLARSRRTDTEAAAALSDISASLRRKKR